MAESSKILTNYPALTASEKVYLVRPFIILYVLIRTLVFTTGGLPPLVNTPDVVYEKLFGKEQPFRMLM